MSTTPGIANNVGAPPRGAVDAPPRGAGDAPAREAATPSQPVVRVLSPAPRPVAPAPPRGPDLESLLAALQPALDEPTLEASALAVVSALAHGLGCERVSLGIVRAGHLHLLAVSDAPDHAPRSAFAVAMRAAMAEAAEHGQPVGLDAAPGALQAHRELATRGGAVAIRSVPLRHHGTVCGVIVFERLADAAPDPARDPARDRACDALAGVLGPALELKRRDAAWSGLRRLRGCRRLAWLALALAAVAALSLLSVDYRVSAPARLEGRVQRSVVAPFDGFVESAVARAGERVTAGQTLATLQRSTLDLERSSGAAELDELNKQYRRALAGRDRAESGVLEARMAQVRARLDLLDARIARTRITAPFDGIVLRGDLDRSLGAPVARGDLLFEVAPADGYRVVLQAGERDVRDLAPGQQGVLSLAALPDTSLPFTVEHVGGVASTEAGDAVFRVDARLDGALPALRPGMEGVAKVAIEPRPLVWIVTHRFVAWLQLTLWSLLP